MQSAASSFAVTTARPPSAQRSLPSAHARPIPPATALKRIEPAASEPSVVPAVLITEYNSFPAVLDGAMIVSTAPFLPNLRVWPSAKAAPIAIEPASETMLKVEPSP